MNKLRIHEDRPTAARGHYCRGGGLLEVRRRIVAWVEIDGEERLMEFLTNPLAWSPETIVALYGCRWQIEVFFKQIKQTLQLADFLGTSTNAVRWQIWTALLVYLRLHNRLIGRIFILMTRFYSIARHNW